MDWDLLDDDDDDADAAADHGAGILTGEDLPDDVMDMVRRNLRDMAEAQLAVAREQQLKAAEFFQAVGRSEAVTVDGVGQCILRITPAAYHYWGQRLGYDCWGDGQFRHEFLRDNEAARVRYAPRTANIIRP